MPTKLLSSQKVIYQIILFFTFSLSVNYFVELKYINFIAYAFFHITLVYLAIYYFNFFLFFIYFLYGVFFDIFLINYIAPHLISFLLFISIFYYMKKFLLNFSSYKISYIILLVIFFIFASETIIAKVLLNYPINIENLITLILSTMIFFLPCLLLFSKIDKL